MKIAKTVINSLTSYRICSRLDTIRNKVIDASQGSSDDGKLILYTNANWWNQTFNIDPNDIVNRQSSTISINTDDMSTTYLLKFDSTGKYGRPFI